MAGSTYTSGPAFTGAVSPSSANDHPRAISRSDLAAMEAELRKHEADHERLEELALRSTTATIPLAVPYDRELDPNEPLVMGEQIWMYHELDENGLAGLNLAMTEIAHLYDLHLSKVMGYVSTWRHIIERQQDIILLNMLNSTEFEFLKAMIRGDLMRRYYAEGEFKWRVLRHHTLEKPSGNYLQMACRPEYLLVELDDCDSDVGTQASRQIQNKHRGKGFTYSLSIGRAP